MGRFDEFELPVRKIQDYPLIYEALIPSECSFFQDVRRYQSVTTHLDVKTIDIGGEITLDREMVHVPISKLSASEKKAFIDYLKVRVGRGDNIGSSWAFFRSATKKKNILAYGANIVYKDPVKGQERAKQLLSELRQSETKTAFILKSFIALMAASILLAAGWLFYSKVYLGNAAMFKRYFASSDSAEMQFYKDLFPDVHAWKKGEDPEKKSIAEALLDSDYITDILAGMGKEAYKGSDDDNNTAVRLCLFIYFNYNQRVIETLKNHKTTLFGTELTRLSKIYSCAQSGYSSNIFYFKVGDLAIKHSEISHYLKQNRVTFRDYTKLRDEAAFSEILEKDAISYKLKSYLTDVYTFSPLRVEKPTDGIDWYLLVRTPKENPGGKPSFAAFFKQGESTLVPKLISSDLMGKSKKSGIYSWYAVDPAQAKALVLSKDSLVYFTEKMGQLFKLDVIKKKIKQLKLKKIKGSFPVSVHRELLMEDSKGKYGIQCYDPVTSLVLSNLISKSSFEEASNLTLKRDPIQVNTSLVQLSKDDSFSTQAINITPGKTGIVKLFNRIDRFTGKLANGDNVRFEKASLNLFNPFSFMVYSDSITFSYRHEISGMSFEIDEKMLKIIKSDDGGHQIIQVE